MEQPGNNPDPIKPDLKHDNMDFNAATEGDDVLDTDKESPLQLEEENISAEELSLLEEDEIEDQEAALISAETDSREDEDNFINEPDTKTELEIMAEDDGGQEEDNERS